MSAWAWVLVAVTVPLVAEHLARLVLAHRVRVEHGMYVGMGNVLGNGQVGMLFVGWAKGNRLRVHGRATIDFDDPLTETYPEAQFVVRVRTTEIWPNCPRYVHRMVPAERSVFVPEEGRRTPVPGWKRAEWAVDVLPEGDPALDPDAPVV